jgi:hypothetical protein
MRLASAGNVEVPAILLLEEWGYVLATKAPGPEGWIARRGDTELIADGPLELLGLAALVGARGEEWRATDVQIADALARFGMT